LENAAGLRSGTRLVKTGDAHPDSVAVTYLHPEDSYYDFSGHSPATPTVVRTPSGKLLVAVTVFADRSQWPADPQLTLIYQSTDEGKNWDYVCDIVPMLDGGLYVHKGTIYLFGVDTSYGNLIVGKSEDDGLTWSTPVTLARGEGPRRWGWHAVNTPFLEHNGRVYKAIEYGYVNPKPTAEDIANNPTHHVVLAGNDYTLCHYQSVISIDADADWMVPQNWTIAALSIEESVDPNQCIEGNLAVLPDGTMVNLLRTMRYGISLEMVVNTQDPHAPMQFGREVTDFPLSVQSKFTIHKDPTTGYYIAIGSETNRKHLCMAVSKDFREWKVVHSIVDARETKNAFSYPNWIFSGNDLLILVRTAWNGAVNDHDNNMITFHKVTNYRQYL